HAREDMTHHRVVDLIVNSKLDLKWIGERFERFADKLDTDYRDELSSQIKVLREFVQKAEADWKSVDANEFANAKQRLDEASVRLQEVSITESLKQQ
ncbi:MAG: hypothetical protein AAFY46_17395, partial [Planctomycetota bacterium]